MKISQETLENFTLSYPLEHITPLENVLFVDIETTGFTAKSSYLYLIGCVYYSAGKWNIIQWMAENYTQEVIILKKFFQFAQSYQFLIHFNGNHFDLPYLLEKCEQFKLPYNFNAFQGIDLYKRISPYTSFLNLPNCKQKTLEQFLGINRQDIFTNGELISFYHEYVKSPTEFSEKSLFLHNSDALKGMLEILSLLSYYDLFNNSIKARKVQANYYKDYNGKKRQELFITISLPTALPKAISASANHCYFKGQGQEGTIKIPIYEEELKYFYSNYQDYYYLPTEDIALHKSIATFVDENNRLPATAATCYTRKQSVYLPQWGIFIEPFFKKTYKSQELFFELTDELKKNRAAFTAYASHVLDMIASNS